MKSFYILLVLAFLIAASSESLLGKVKKIQEKIRAEFKTCIDEKGSEVVKTFCQNAKDLKWIFKTGIKTLKKREDRLTMVKCKAVAIKKYASAQYKNFISSII